MVASFILKSSSFLLKCALAFVWAHGSPVVFYYVTKIQEEAFV